jgi:polyisoprenoid-binding protein YceI
MKAALLLFFVSCLPAVTFADWDLDSDSSVSLVSIKSNSIGEVHHFKTLTGSLSDDGILALSIDLNSIETGIPIRNERMQKYLFETAAYPSAEVTGSIDIEKYKKLKKGESLQENISVTIAMRGVEKSYYIAVETTKLKGGALGVESVKPLMIFASDFKLGAGIAKLMELAGLPSIATAVPVNFNIRFNEAD